MLGRVLAERYQIEEKIAEGGMARVYRGRDLLLKRTIAIKILKDQMTGDAAFIRRFEREAQSAAGLSHPNIVNVYDVGDEDGIYYIIMELIDGKNLKEYIKEKGRLSTLEAAKITRQIAEALQVAHEFGVVHRDIKPQNILLTRDGSVKVTDFGIAIAGDGATVTIGNEIIGSVQYFSPEQARGEVAGKKSDLYSLGIILYEILTGKVPYSGESPVAVAMKHLQEQIIPPRRLVSSIPDSLEQVVMKAVEKDSADRYSSIDEFLEDLKSVENSRSPRKAVKRKPREENFEEDDYVLKPFLASSGNNHVEKRQKRSGKWIFTLLIILVLGGAIAVGYNYIAAYLFLPEVAVPGVHDFSHSEASRVLRAEGLVPNDEVEYIYDDQVQVGNVVRTEPPEGRVVRKSRTIDLFVSKGPEKLVAPDLIGRTEMEARIILRDLGLELGEPIREHNEDVERGLIFRQVPSASLTVTTGDEITVYVSEGRGPFKIDDLVGFSEEGAITYLDDNDLKYRLRYRFSVGSVGHVLEQFPPGGEEVKPGQFVELIIGE